MVRTLGHNPAQAGVFFFLYFHSSLYYAAETGVSLYLSLQKNKNEKNVYRLWGYLLNEIMLLLSFHLCGFLSPQHFYLQHTYELG